MRYGIVGTGYWGKNHVRVATELAAEGLLDEVVVCDVDQQRASSLAGRFDVEYVTDFRRLDVDLASVATPSTTHESIATRLLETGVDLLVEKPLALDSTAAWNIVETARTNDRTLAVGHIFRYHPALRELKRWIDEGRLGRVKYLHTARFSFRIPRNTTGVLYSLAVHDVDIYQYLLDRSPTRIYCNRDCHLRGDIDETTTLTLDYGDATGVIHSSWQVPVFGKRRDIAVVGTDASAYLDYRTDTEIELFEATITETESGHLDLRDEGSTVYEMAELEPLKAEIRGFVEAARDGTKPLAHGEVGARTVDILERAEHADDVGQVVSVDPVQSVSSQMD